MTEGFINGRTDVAGTEAAKVGETDVAPLSSMGELCTAGACISCLTDCTGASRCECCKALQAQWLLKPAPVKLKAQSGREALMTSLAGHAATGKGLSGGKGFGDLGGQGIGPDGIPIRSRSIGSLVAVPVGLEREAREVFKTYRRHCNLLMQDLEAEEDEWLHWTRCCYTDQEEVCVSRADPAVCCADTPSV